MCLTNFVNAVFILLRPVEQSVADLRHVNLYELLSFLKLFLEFCTLRKQKYFTLSTIAANLHYKVKITEIADTRDFFTLLIYCCLLIIDVYQRAFGAQCI